MIDEILGECPISSVDPEAAELLTIINMCEGEFGGSRTPASVLEDTAYYHNVRSIILQERGRIDRWRKKKEKKPGKR